MNKNVTFIINDDIYEKYNIACNLTGETDEQAIESALRLYIAKAFANVSKEYTPKLTSLSENKYKDHYGKALHRIPMWALKSNQYNHKIIKSYFMSIHIAGEANLHLMEQLCSDKERSDLYVPTFKNNYSQMKIDGPKSHGKVFEDDGYKVWLWDEVGEVIMKYKFNFYVEE